MFMLILQVKNDIRLIDNVLGTPESTLKDIERVMVNAGMNRMFLTTPNEYSFHEYIIYTLYQMVDEYFEGMIDIGKSGWNDYEKYSFIDSIYDDTLKAIDEISWAENKGVLDKVLTIEDRSKKNHELHVRIQSAVAINQ